MAGWRGEQGSEGCCALRGPRRPPSPPPLSPPQDVDGLGAAGDTVAVRPGYARNFLVPGGAAVGVRPARADRAARVPRSTLRERATASAAAASSSSSPAEADAAAAAAAAARRLAAVARRLAAAAVELPRTGDAKGRLFDPVTAADIAAVVAEDLKVALDPALVDLGDAASIPTHGEHAVPLRLRLGDDRVTLTVRIGEGVTNEAGPKAAPEKDKGR